MTSEPRPDGDLSEPVVIKVRLDGPYKVTGPALLIDHEGNPIARPDDGKPGIILCRCGHSATKPFCDQTHKRIDFHA